jgi:hypothetical protein
LCPPGLLPRRSRRLRVRFGFCSPSLDGGLPLLLLFSPSRRSSSATFANRVAICACCAAVRASRSSVEGRIARRCHYHLDSHHAVTSQSDGPTRGSWAVTFGVVSTRCPLIGLSRRHLGPTSRPQRKPQSFTCLKMGSVAQRGNHGRFAAVALSLMREALTLLDVPEHARVAAHRRHAINGLSPQQPREPSPSRGVEEPGEP